jgi:Flp pilus assembly protein TadD
VEVAERRPAAARAVLADLVARAPYNPDAVEAFAELLAVIGETDAAIEQYARAAALRPGAARTWTSLGMLRQQRGDAAGAQDAYERTLAIDPRHGVAANNLAWLYADAGRLEEAERLAGLAWRALRAAPQVRDTLARIHRLKGQSPSGSATTRE